MTVSGVVQGQGKAKNQPDDLSGKCIQWLCMKTGHREDEEPQGRCAMITRGGGTNVGSGAYLSTTMGTIPFFKSRDSQPS